MSLLSLLANIVEALLERARNLALDQRRDFLAERNVRSLIFFFTSCIRALVEGSRRAGEGCSRDARVFNSDSSSAFGGAQLY